MQCGHKKPTTFYDRQGQRSEVVSAFFLNKGKSCVDPAVLKFIKNSRLRKLNDLILNP
jgi:hypothetical protein